MGLLDRQRCPGSASRPILAPVAAIIVLTITILVCAPSATAGPATASAPNQQRSNELPIDKVGTLGPRDFSFPLARGSFIATATASSIPLTLPAAAGTDPRPRSIMGLEFVENELGGGLFYWQPNYITLGYRHIDAKVLGHHEDHYFGAIAYNASGRGAAGHVSYLTSSAGGKQAWSLGGSVFAERGGRLTTAFLFENINKPKFIETTLPRTFVFGIALRPLSPSSALAVDFRYRDADQDDFLARYGLEMEPTQGFFFATSYDTDGVWRLSFALGSEDTHIGHGISNGDGLNRQFTHIGYEQRRGLQQAPR